MMGRRGVRVRIPVLQGFTASEVGAPTNDRDFAMDGDQEAAAPLEELPLLWPTEVDWAFRF